MSELIVVNLYLNLKDFDHNCFAASNIVLAQNVNVSTPIQNYI